MLTSTDHSVRMMLSKECDVIGRRTPIIEFILLCEWIGLKEDISEVTHHDVGCIRILQCPVLIDKRPY
jgi:hypothetical protein